MNDFIIEKIKEEKRRRNQAYHSLDYFLKHISYFDFFSKDAFGIVKRAMLLGVIFEKTIIETEIFFLPFFDPKNRVNKLLKNFDINEAIIPQIVSSENAPYEKYSFLKDLFYGPNYDDEKYEQEREFSHELKLIFKKAAENSLSRFKTPIISSEILFITLMEESTGITPQIIRRMMKTEMNWYLFRYELIKKIHNEESLIKNEILINQHYFAYLLKRELTDFQLDRVIENESFQPTVSLFRNTLISNVLHENIFNKLSQDVKKSIKIRKSRRYST